MVVCQRCTNIGPTEAALLAFCEGNPSITDGFPSQKTRNAGVDVCLNNRLNKQSSWVTGDLRHQCDRRQCNMSKDVTVLFRRCTGLIQTQCTKEQWLVAGRRQAIIWTNAGIYCQLDSCKQWEFNRNSYICIQENAFENVVWKNGVHFVWASLS